MSVFVRTGHTSRSRSSAVVGIWRSLGWSSFSSVLQCRSYCVEGLDGRVPPSPSAADPLSGEFSPAVPTTQRFGADRPVYDWNDYPRRKCEGFRVYPPIIKLRGTALSEEERPKSCHDSPRQGFASGKELPIGSACGRGSLHLSSATTTSEAIAILKHRQQQGLSIDSYMLVEILKRCSMQKDLIATRQVHDYVNQSGMQKHKYVATTLLSVYIKCGRLQDARGVFDGFERTDRTVITWNLMIGAYAKSGCGMEAYRLFHQMEREGFTPNDVTYLSILNVSASEGALEWVKEVHGHARKSGLVSNIKVGNALVHMYAKSGRVDDARLLFDRLEERDAITWNTLIGAYAESGCGVEAYRLFHQMEREGFKPDAITYLSILNPSASAGALDWVKEVHGHARDAGLESNLKVGNALIHMYAKSGSVDDARLLFDRMGERDAFSSSIMIGAYVENGNINDARLVFDRTEKRNVITWNTMIGGLAVHGCGEEALKLFKEMIADCVKPDGTSLLAVLSACSHAGLVDDGRRILSAMMQDYGIEPTVVHYSCMVDLLGRAGRLKEAKLLIDNMPVAPNVVTWKALLGACRTYSNEELGECAAKEVLKLEPKDAAAYVLLSNIYAAAGKWLEKVSVRTMMEERGVRKEPGLSWIEVDNKIHEFVSGDKSHPEAKAIYSELKKLTEQLKAKGYIPDTKLVLHNIDEEDKELAICSHSEKLAIVYGLLRVPRGKPLLVKKNLRVCSDCHAANKLISVVTERDILLRDANRFHHFKDGLCSCGDYW